MNFVPKRQHCVCLLPRRPQSEHMRTFTLGSPVETPNGTPAYVQN